MTEVRFIDLSSVIKADARGMSFFPWPRPLEAPGDLLATLHLVSIQPGHTRGNHLHPGHVEMLYPFHGAALLLWEDPPGRLRERRLTGDRILVRIPPGIPHAVTNPGPEILYLLAWREAAEDGRATPDTVPHPLV